jgi:hypothetical protein
MIATNDVQFNNNAIRLADTLSTPKRNRLVARWTKVNNRLICQWVIAEH